MQSIFCGWFLTNKTDKMIIGITGSFGSGKTTVANMFSRHGFKVINVDKLYHGIYNKNKALKEQIKREFGTLDRNKIKKIVFNDAKQLKKLNKITHPAIINEIKKEISAIINNSNKKYSIITNSNNTISIIKKINKKITTIKKANKKFIINKYKNEKLNIGKNKINDKIKIIIDAPLLIETKLKNYVDRIIVVKCSKKEQIKRLLKKKKYTTTEIEQIIKSQMPLKEKIKYADFVIDDSKTIKETEEQIKEFLAKTLKTHN